MFREFGSGCRKFQMDFLPRIGTFSVLVALIKSLRFQRHNLFPHIL